MIYVLAFVVLLLAAAVVALFAMLGELHARVGPVASAPTRPLAEATIGHRPDTWPAELDRLGSADDAVLLVLSSACQSCAQVARQLRDLPDPVPGRAMGVVLSTADADRGRDFLREHGLPRESVYLDIGGNWVAEEFGVRTSPSALVLRAGQLASAVLFTDLAALRTATVLEKEAV